jgi:hypothetical protein
MQREDQNTLIILMDESEIFYHRGAQRKYAVVLCASLHFLCGYKADTFATT